MASVPEINYTVSNTNSQKYTWHNSSWWQGWFEHSMSEAKGKDGDHISQGICKNNFTLTAQQSST